MSSKSGPQLFEEEEKEPADVEFSAGPQAGNAAQPLAALPLTDGTYPLRVERSRFLLTTWLGWLDSHQRCGSHSPVP